MGSVSGELDRGTAALVLAQPATRGAFLAAKLVAIGDRARGRRPGGDRRRVDLHRDPVRAAAGGRVAGDGRALVARAHGLGGDHVPRLGRDRLHDGRGRRRVRGPDRRQPPGDRARARPAAADGPRRCRRSSSRQGVEADLGRLSTAVLGTAVLVVGAPAERSPRSAAGSSDRPVTGFACAQAPQWAPGGGCPSPAIRDPGAHAARPTRRAPRAIDPRPTSRATGAGRSTPGRAMPDRVSRGGPVRGHQRLHAAHRGARGRSSGRSAAPRS